MVCSLALQRALVEGGQCACTDFAGEGRLLGGETQQRKGAPYVGTPIAMGKNRRDSERCVRLPLLVSLQLVHVGGGGALTSCAHARVRSALIVQQERIKHW